MDIHPLNYANLIKFFTVVRVTVCCRDELSSTSNFRSSIPDIILLLVIKFWSSATFVAFGFPADFQSTFAADYN